MLMMWNDRFPNPQMTHDDVRRVSCQISLVYCLNASSTFTSDTRIGIHEEKANNTLIGAHKE